MFKLDVDPINIVMKKFQGYFLVVLIIGLNLLLSACGSSLDKNDDPGDRKLMVVATTTFVGDVVSNIAGEAVDLTTLLEPGQNPHSFQPTPQDLVNVSKADLIFVNGLELEEFLEDLLIGADAVAPVIEVSEGIKALDIVAQEPQDDEEDDHHSHANQDPHVWFDPNNILVWIENITRVLVEMDPAQEELYKSNASAYRSELESLDSWIREELNQVPLGQRKMVTGHTALMYLTEQYEFELMGAVIPAITTEAETSGHQLADLIDSIREHNVQAIFIGVDFDPALSHRIAEDTNVELVPLYFGSLSEGSPAGTYLDFMRYNVDAIVNVLK